MSSDSNLSSTPDLVVSREGAVGCIELNRPKALNALTYDMILGVEKALLAWQDDASIETVLVTGSGEKAFCAGGDVKQVYEDGKKGNLGKPGFLTFDFFHNEYRLNALIAAYKKPIVSVWDGIVMGGGVGVSIMGKHRIGTEKLKFGMPETAIGFFPDVGGAYFMSRMGPIGTLLSLTGQALGAGDSFAIGAATDFVPSADISAFVETMKSNGLTAALDKYTTAAPNVEKFENLKEIAEKHFQFDTVEEIFTSLETDTSETAVGILTILKKRSPAAMKVTLRQLQEGEDLDFNACLEMEFRIAQRALQEKDFYEGIRAVLVDKDHAPNWSPKDLAGVSEEFVAKHFESLCELELKL